MIFSFPRLSLIVSLKRVSCYTIRSSFKRVFFFFVKT
nr:MAG TPA: hypothetical protein [Caudoviricetes sp.]